LLLPVFRPLCQRWGWVDAPGHRKIHDSPIPLAGGFSVLAGMLVPLVLAYFLIQSGVLHLSNTQHYLQHGIDRRENELLAIVIGALVVVITGAVDDRFELKPLFKFSGQLLAALIVANSNVRITLFVHNTAFSYAITLLWFLTVINAMNFMDNMNGLCAGIGAIGSLSFGLIAASKGQYLVAALALLGSGSLAGFLPHNFPKATAFLGDTGSHLTGYLLAVMAVLPHFSTAKHPNHWAVLLPLLVLFVPLADLAYVVILRWRLGTPFYVGDTNHLSHRLVRNGFSKTNAVLLIWMMSMAFGGLALGLSLLFG